jgi:hypothetical protein
VIRQFLVEEAADRQVQRFLFTGKNVSISRDGGEVIRPEHLHLIALREGLHNIAGDVRRLIRGFENRDCN